MIAADSVASRDLQGRKGQVSAVQYSPVQIETGLAKEFFPESRRSVSETEIWGQSKNSSDVRFQGNEVTEFLL